LHLLIESALLILSVLFRNFAGKQKKFMSIIETIEQRRSVRTYTGEPLNRELIDRIRTYIAGLKAPFGANVRIEFVHSCMGTEPVKLGTYGYIGGASDFLALICEPDYPLAKESASYLFEQVILFCTGLGLGTCWLGASFSRKNFERRLVLNAKEKLIIVSPVGYGSEKKRFWEILSGSEKHHRSRKPFESRFFYKDFATPLTKELAGIYFKPLEMVRLAPSANNQQSWRAVQDERGVHFYQHLSLIGFNAIDLGIALCHFEQTCCELGITGQFKALNPANDIPVSKGELYSISWIA
jgi:nitroreductase